MSLFVQFSSLEEKKTFGKELEAKVNSHFQHWVQKEFQLESHLSIEFEKLFDHFFIASKKRYAGFDALSQSMVYVGIESVRGDWTELAKEFQQTILQAIFKGASKQEVEHLITEVVEKLRAGKLDSKAIYRKKITKKLSDYTKTTPPHVKAARELENFKGRLVEYVMTKEGPKHLSLFDTKHHTLDYDHYIEKQLKGVSDEILESFGVDFDVVVYQKSQKSLNKFF